MKFIHIRHTQNRSWFDDLWKYMPEYIGISPGKGLMEELTYAKPDIIFIQSAISYSSKQIDRMRSLMPNVKIIGHHNTFLNDRIIQNLKSFDLVFVGMEVTRDVLTSHGINAEIMLHAFDTLRYNPDIPKTHGLLISGTLSHRFHKQRIALVESLVKINSISLYCKLDSNSIRKQLFRLSIGEKPYSRYSKELKKYNQPPKSGLELYDEIRRHKIVFDCHADIATEATNMRMFEVCGLGTLLITNHFDNCPFIPDKEILTYKSEEELHSKINWALQNPDEADKIARAGRQRVANDHAVEHRADVFNNLLRRGILNAG